MPTRRKFNNGVRTSFSRRNPETKSARKMAEEFHGRKVRSEIIIDELVKEPSDLAVIGRLEELVVTPLEDCNYEYPISFEKQKSSKNEIWVSCDAEGKQIYFVGGDQNLDNILDQLETKDSFKQTFIVLGFCHFITYFTDKHHLEGDDEQQFGVPYEHEFGEQGGTWPILLYDTENKKMMLSGGTYEVRDVGIWN